MSDLIQAAKCMDWEQVIQNGGPPCFFLDEHGFCGRAQRWLGHTEKNEYPEHRFISLQDLLLPVSGLHEAVRERDRLVEEVERLDALVAVVEDLKTTCARLADDLAEAQELLEITHNCATIQYDGICQGCSVSVFLTRIAPEVK